MAIPRHSVLDANLTNVMSGIFSGAFGDSDNRPQSPTSPQMYFDTTLGMPIFWNGSEWVDAAGSALGSSSSSSVVPEPE